MCDRRDRSITVIAAGGCYPPALAGTQGFALHLGVLESCPVQQAWVAQSELTLHSLPGGHFCAQFPPQSTSVSSPFFTPSVQDGAAHVPYVQTPLLQSASIMQGAPSGATHVPASPQMLLRH